MELSDSEWIGNSDGGNKKKLYTFKKQLEKGSFSSK